MSGKPATRRRRWLRRLALAGVAAVAVWLGLSFAAARRLTRRAQPPRPEPVPAVAWATLSPVRLLTADGETVGAWYGSGYAGRPPVIFLHGNGGTRESCLDAAEFCGERGHPVLLITARAHGDSTGEFNDVGYGARHDVVAGAAWLAGACPGRPVIVWGRSLGAAAAVFAAPALEGRLAGLVLECPYRDLETAVRNRLALHLPPGASHAVALGLRAVAPAVLPDLDRISPVLAARGVPTGVPVLVLAGGADRRATVAEARDITAALGDRAELVVIDRADHLALPAADPEGYRRAVRGRLGRWR